MSQAVSRERLPDADTLLRASTKSRYGISADVYILEDGNFLKIFPASYEKSRIEWEKMLLAHLSHMQVPRIVGSFSTQRGEAILYERLDGTHPFEPSMPQLARIGAFLAGVHDYGKKALAQSDFANYAPAYELPAVARHFEKLRRRIDFEPRRETILHCDPFPDNILFVGERLSGFIDFSDASLGDPRFDLGVALMSMCMDEDRVDRGRAEALLGGYGGVYSADSLEGAVDFALFHYMAKRLDMGKKSYLKLYEILIKRLKKRS